MRERTLLESFGINDLIWGTARLHPGSAAPKETTSYDIGVQCVHKYGHAPQRDSGGDELITQFS
jgi:hypothetical protein